MIGRRTFLKALVAGAASLLPVGAYASFVEPVMRLQTTRYRIRPPGWPEGRTLRLVVLADLHACRPWMPPERIARLCDYANDLGGDAILLLGDYASQMRFATDHLSPEECVAGLAGLRAPLGVHAVFGNHDWWSDEEAQRNRLTETAMHGAFRSAGISVLSNRAVRVGPPDGGVWIAGLEDQLAYLDGRRPAKGLDDLPGTLAQVADDAPVILLAHEPDIFPDVPDRVALTLSGHTHGGQINFFGWRPVVPSRYGARYAYGHIVEGGRNLIVSGGLGCSGIPIRFLSPPEIVVVELG